MAKLLRPQTRAILLRLNAGKPAAQIAKELSVPVYTVYNTKHRHTALLKTRKAPTVASGIKPLSQRVFEFIKAYPDLRAHEYGDAFVTLGDKKSSVVGTITHLVNAGLVERDKATKKLTAVATEYHPLQQELVSRYKQTAYKPVKKKPAVVAPLPSEDVDSLWGLSVAARLAEPLVVTPAPTQVSLWGRIKAVFTGGYS
jgi:hypothetical protein